VLYENQVAVRGKIGCPVNPGGEQAVQGADQIFASGTMYWWKNQDTVYVMPEGESPSGRYSVFNKVTAAALPDPPTDIDPKMRAEGGFARVYYGVPEVQNAIGVPVTAERAISGAYQAFEHGFMIYSPANGTVRGKTIYVLYNDGTFRRYDDLNPN
jgi:hypothetical protein